MFKLLVTTWFTNDEGGASVCTEVISFDTKEAAFYASNAITNYGFRDGPRQRVIELFE